MNQLVIHLGNSHLEHGSEHCSEPLFASNLMEGHGSLHAEVRWSNARSWRPIASQVTRSTEYGRRWRGEAAWESGEVSHRKDTRKFSRVAWVGD